MSYQEVHDGIVTTYPFDRDAWLPTEDTRTAKDGRVERRYRALCPTGNYMSTWRDVAAISETGA